MEDGSEHSSIRTTVPFGPQFHSTMHKGVSLRLYLPLCEEQEAEPDEAEGSGESETEQLIG
jgi:hypothetical protein